MEENNTIKTTCCIAGGGPAGVMLGFLLARTGVDILVLEKHKDFFRDFRGDTIHPSTFQLMYELGLLEEFLKVPHQEIKDLRAVFNGNEVPVVDFSHLNVAKPVIGLMPQWDFLNFLSEQGRKYKSFHLKMEAEVTDLVIENGKVTGVVANTPDGPLQVKATLIIGTDGRSSIVREKANLKVINTGAPIDVLWFRLSIKEGDPPQALGRFNSGRIMVLFKRDTYWQCAYVIGKNGFKVIQQNGLEKFRRDLTEVSPFFADRVSELNSWGDIKLLSVAIDHLEKWYTDGLLCIGDAAHAMSPIGGVGINLAVQDAVAAANILYPYLKNSEAPVAALKRVQNRREWPTRVIQKVQVLLQKGIEERRQSTSNELPLLFKLYKYFPIMRRLPALIVGMGIRPEHIQTPEIK